MGSVFSIGVAGALALHALLAGGPGAAQQAARPDGSIDGIWQGEIGGQPVRACFDGSIASFYRLGDRQIVTLWADDALNFAERDERNPESPRWRLLRAGADELGGRRVQGDASQPLRLQRVPFVARPATDEAMPETPCRSFAYHR